MFSRLYHVKNIIIFLVYSLRKVTDISIDSLMSISDLVKGYGKAGGFTARYISEAHEILVKSLKNKDTRVFLSFTADIIATGLRGIIRDMIKLNWIDIIITTCGSWDHDIARTFKDYYIGDFYVDDKKLLEKGIHRLGNIYVPKESYGITIERFTSKLLNELYSNNIRSISTYELSWYIGERLNESAILWWCWKKKIPLIVPGPYDGAVGSQIWIFQQRHRDFKIDLFKDESLLSDLVFESKQTAGIIIGGGISKHHLLWWNQFKDGLDYAIQITTGIELDGSLSGARLKEAISWRKVSDKGRCVTIWGDATIILPIIVASAYQEVGERKIT